MGDDINYHRAVSAGSNHGNPGLGVEFSRTYGRITEIGETLRPCCGKAQRELRTAGRAVLDRDGAGVRFNDAPHDQEPQTEASRPPAGHGLAG